MEMSHHRIEYGLGIAAATMCVFAVTPALAWGDNGHRIVCTIAMKEVSDGTRTRVEQLMQQIGPNADFAAGCTFPDHPRQRAEEHFVNLPRNAAGVTNDLCPESDICVLSAILADFAILRRTDAADAAKLDAIRFLGHWVGDIHQPLHVSFEDDRGGNSVKVTGVCSANLHGTWDNCLVSKAVGDNVVAAADTLAAEITAEERAAWSTFDVIGWANESFAIATAFSTHYCVVAGDVCEYEPGNPTLDPGEPRRTVQVDDAYVDDAKPIVRQRLKQAGVRLAHLLDEALRDR
jgi:hypothetical protein